jgi:formyl-CoA transferase
MLADMGAASSRWNVPAKATKHGHGGRRSSGARSAYFPRNESQQGSIALDFKRSEGRRVIDRLVDSGGRHRRELPARDACTDFGLDYASLTDDAAPTDLTHQSPDSGKRASGGSRPDIDAVVQAEGGLMSITGDPQGPPFRVGVAIADLVAGMLAAHGSSSLLCARRRTAAGSRWTSACSMVVISILSYHASMHLTANIRSRRVGNRHATIAPYDTFSAADGDFLSGRWQRRSVPTVLRCRRHGVAVWRSQIRHESGACRSSRRTATAPVAHPQREATGLLARDPDSKRACHVETCRDVPEALADPQILAREMIQSVEHATAGMLKWWAVPIKTVRDAGFGREPRRRRWVSILMRFCESCR